MKEKLKWNLTELFSNVEECKSSFDEIAKMIEKMEDWKSKKLNSADLKRLLDDYFACKELAYRCLVYGSLMYYADSSNEGMSELKVSVEKLNTNTDAALSFIDELILHEGEDSIRSMLDKDDSLAIYRFYLEDLLNKRNHAISTPEKAKLLSEISDLNKEYNETLAKVTFEPITVDGKEVELSSSNAPKYLAARDHETRRSAFESLNRGYAVHAEDAARILNEIMRRRIKVAKIEGYQSVKEYSLDKENIAAHLIDDLINVVHKNRDKLQSYMALKKTYTNLSEAHLYDLGVPIDSGIKRKFPIEEGFIIAKEAFATLGSSYTSIVEDLIERGHIDAIPDEKKHPTITFSWLGYSFLNYKDSYNDLKNLVHELGHSINDSLSQNLPFPYRISTVFAGETASIVNEILLNRSLLDHANTDEERIFYLAKEIDNFITSIFRQTMYTELEDILYKKVESGVVLTPDLLNDTYLELLKSYYGEGIIYDELSAFEWMRVGRMFRWTYYSYTYATGLLIANIVYSRIKDGSLPIETYLNFLASGSKEPSLELLSHLGIDFQNSSMIDSGFEVMAKDIEELSSLIENIDNHI